MVTTSVVQYLPARCSMGSHVLSLVDQPTHFTWYWVTPFDSRPATTLDRLRLVRVLASSRVEGSGRRALGPRRRCPAPWALPAPPSLSLRRWRPWLRRQAGAPAFPLSDGAQCVGNDRAPAILARGQQKGPRCHEMVRPTRRYEILPLNQPTF